MQVTHSLDGLAVVAVPVELALYPFGVFSTFVVVDGAALGFSAHLDRLRADAQKVWGHDLDEVRLRADIRAHTDQLTEPATVRVTLYPRDLDMASPAVARGCRTLVSSRPASFPSPPVSNFSVQSVDYQRELPGVKSTALFSQIRLRREAQLVGYDDVLFRRGDEALEGATWSVLCWRNGTVVTPEAGVLRSITVDHLGNVAKTLGWLLERRPLRVAELASAELVLAVNSNFPARALQQIDHETVRVNQVLLEDIAVCYAALRREPIGGA